MNKSLHIASDQKGALSHKASLKVPSFLIEYAYYALLVYAMLGDAWGVAVPLVGGGALAGLAILCLMHFGQGSQGLMGAFRPIGLALGCAISALVIQFGLHQQSYGDSDVRALVTWAFTLIVIQSVSLRKGFFHRFALVAFLIGCSTLPYLTARIGTEDIIRWGTTHKVGLSNPNALAAWFGFCAVYFLIVGLETRNYMVRIASWSAGLLSLYIIVLTVSRGPLLGVAIAAVLAFEKVLKRSFVPILGILCLMWLIYVSGLVDTLVGNYVIRGAEESGRSYLWKAGFRRFLDSWWGGEGMSNIGIIRPGHTFESGPHNALLIIGMSSGIIPFAFFVGYLVRAARRAFYARTQQTPYAPYILPLCAFAFLEMMIQGWTFMLPWTLVVLSLAMSADATPRSRQLRLGKKARLNTGRSPTSIL